MLQPRPHSSFSFFAVEKGAHYGLDKLDLVYTNGYLENLCSKFVIRDQREWTIKICKKTKSKLLTEVRRILGLLVLKNLIVLKNKRARRGILQTKKGKSLPQILFQSYLRKVKENVERDNFYR